MEWIFIATWQQKSYLKLFLMSKLEAFSPMTFRLLIKYQKRQLIMLALNFCPNLHHHLMVKSLLLLVIWIKLLKPIKFLLILAISKMELLISIILPYRVIWNLLEKIFRSIIKELAQIVTFVHAKKSLVPNVLKVLYKFYMMN